MAAPRPSRLLRPAIALATLLLGLCPVWIAAQTPSADTLATIGEAVADLDVDCDHGARSRSDGAPWLLGGPCGGREPGLETDEGFAVSGVGVDGVAVVEGGVGGR